MRSIIEMPRGPSRLMADERGNVGIIFGIALLPVMFFAGAATDYGRALNARTVLQAAADAAVVAAANSNGDEDAKRRIAADVFTANASAQGSTVAAPTLTAPTGANAAGGHTFSTTTAFGTASTSISIAPTGITVSPTINVPTTFMRLAGIESIPVSTASLATGSTKKLEIAMMVDLTGSMGWNDRASSNPQPKINGLKTAATDFLNILFPNGATFSNSTRVAIIPFADYVNAGTYASAVTGLPETGTLANGGLYAKKTNLAQTKQGAWSGNYAGSFSNLNTAGATPNASQLGGQFGAQSPYQQSGVTAPTNASGNTYVTAHCSTGSSPVGNPPTDKYHSASSQNKVWEANMYDNNNLGEQGWSYGDERTNPKNRTSGKFVLMPATVTASTSYMKDGSNVLYGIKISTTGSNALPAQVKKVGTGAGQVASFLEVTSYNNGEWVATANSTAGTAFVPIWAAPNYATALTWSPSNDDNGNGSIRPLGIKVPEGSGGTDPACTTAVDQPDGKLITCVTERKGTNAYTEVAPSGTPNTPNSSNWIGSYNQTPSGTPNKENYSSDGICYVAGRELPKVIPMTNQKATLTEFFDKATVGGATPGHIGTAWAWYMLSPEWNSFFPSASAAQPYTDEQTIKAAILMTDGEYNVHYATAGAATQALALCTAMKEKGIRVYTIGFGFPATASSDSTSEANARAMLKSCATNADTTAFFPYDGPTLKQHLVSIGNQLNSLALNQIKVSQ